MHNKTVTIMDLYEDGIMRNDYDAVRHAVENDPELVFCRYGSLESTVLHYAAMAGQVDLVKFLLESGADPNAKETAGKTPLHYASAIADVRAMEILIDADANLNASDSGGITPLKEAAVARTDLVDKNEAVSLLIKRGATVDLGTAIRMNLENEALSILSKIPGTPIDEEYGGTLLCDTVRRHNTNLAKSLLLNGVPADALSMFQETALAVACNDRQAPLSIVEILIQHGADPTKYCPAFRETPRQLAENSQRADVLRLVSR